jgi:FkbM family methyltransferase
MGSALLTTYQLGRTQRTALESAVRALTKIVWLGDDRILCRILGRFKFYVDAGDQGLAPHLMMDGFWEMWLTQFLCRHIRRGWTVVDVGANYGYYSVLMADLVGRKGCCIAVEPNPAVAAELANNLAINGFSARARVAALALGSGAENALRFHIPLGEPKNARVVAADWTHDPGQGRVIDVPAGTLDALAADLPAVHFVKIDAEGAEHEIFRGMADILVRDRPDMILEFNYRRIADPEGFLDEITRHYGVLRYLDEDRRIVRISRERLARDNLGQDWLLFLSVRWNWLRALREFV